jgi:hypothetical protein
MIRQPWGCLLVVLTGCLAIGLTLGFFLAVNMVRSGTFCWGFGTYCVAGAVVVIPFSLLMDFANRVEIRIFFWRRDVPIRRVRGFRNHYRVDYFDGKSASSGKWPEDFESWLTKRPQSRRNG